MPTSPRNAPHLPYWEPPRNRTIHTACQQGDNSAGHATLPNAGKPDRAPQRHTPSGTFWRPLPCEGRGLGREGHLLRYYYVANMPYKCVLNAATSSGILPASSRNNYRTERSLLQLDGHSQDLLVIPL